MEILTKRQRFILLAKHGIIESTNERGKYDIQRIDSPAEFAAEAGLDFIPPLLKGDLSAKHLFRKLTIKDFEEAKSIIE